jgi:3-hydroxy-9,10-secoandrosta-1,3,5(10)-triene-9,17-dione monooxygenase reductase component
MRDSSLPTSLTHTQELIAERARGASALTSERFRHLLGHFATGVTVVTGHCANGPAGMCANSLASLSLDPPLILFCPARSSSTWRLLRDAGSFCVNILASEHEGLARRFARRGEDRFAGVSVINRPSGPALAGALAWIDCELRTEHDGGDHTIVVAEVVAAETALGATPLIFFLGRYWQLPGAGPGGLRRASG